MARRTGKLDFEAAADRSSAGQARRRARREPKSIEILLNGTVDPLEGEAISADAQAEHIARIAAIEWLIGVLDGKTIH